MPEFAYEALTPQGTVSHGEMSASDEAALESQLRIQGHYLIRAESVTARSAGPASATADPAPTRPRTDAAVGRRDLIAFTEYLWGSATAGIPILTTLGDLEHQLDSKRMRRIVAEVRESMVEEGKPLSEALAEHPRAFSSLYIGTVEAGETTGQLDYALRQLVDYLEWQQEITIQIRQATLYPAIVLGIMAGLIALLLAFVYPRLLPIFTGFGVELPLPTRIILTSGALFHEHWRWLLALAVTLPIAWKLIGRTQSGRLAIDTLKLRLPIFGRLNHELEMARLVTYMSLFYRTGVDLMRSLKLLEQMMVNQRVAQAVHRAREAIAGGESMATALAQTRMFPSVVVRSFALGESTGKLDEALERARVYYAREVPAAVKRMLSALQPLLVVLLGGVLAIVALSIFLPIAKIYQAVGQ